MTASTMDAQKIAEAIAQINKAQAEHAEALARVAELERQLQTATDRVDLMLQENFTLKRENKALSRRVVKLATVQSNIGLLTREGQEMLMSMGDILDEETPEQAAAEQKSAAEIVDRLPQLKM